MGAKRLIILLLLFACSDSNEQEGQLFKIKKGNHFSYPKRVGFFTKDVLKFHARFDESAIYDLEGADQDDWNKLLGFSDCGTLHQTNSARIGWKWADNRLQFGSYTYADGVRTMEYLTDGQIGEWIYCTIEKWNGKYTVCVNGVCKDAPRGCNRGFSYWLSVYFGGNLTAPHDIYVWIKE